MLASIELILSKYVKIMRTLEGNVKFAMLFTWLLKQFSCICFRKFGSFVYAWYFQNFWKLLRIIVSTYGGRSKPATTSKMELILTVVIDSWKLRTIVKTSHILDVPAVLYRLLHHQSPNEELLKLEKSDFSIGLCSWTSSCQYSKNSRKILCTEKSLYFDVF